MRALTVRQPYANRLVQGAKSVENRSYRTGIRGPLLIHAGAQVHDRFRGQIISPLGAFVGVVRVVGSHVDGSDECREMCTGPGGRDTGAEFRTDYGISAPVWHWVVAEPLEFVTPIPAKGALGFWESSSLLDHLISLAIAEVNEKRGRS